MGRSQIENLRGASALLQGNGSLKAICSLGLAKGGRRAMVLMIYPPVSACSAFLNMLSLLQCVGSVFGDGFL